jgi:ribonuclease Z
MNKKQKIALGITISVVFILSIGVGVIYFTQPTWLKQFIVSNRIGSAPEYPEIDDGLHALLLGTGSPMPDAIRAGPSTLVIAGEKHFVVDTGPGSAANLAVSGISPAKVDAVFLTHYHSDHIGDLGELMLLRWTMGGYDEPLPVFGPVNVTSVVEGFNDAYQLDSEYRTDHHGEENIPINGSGGIAMEFDIGNNTMASQVIYNQDNIKITMFNVDHLPIYPAVGYKFEYKGRSLVISGDTVYNENLETQSANADLLICEALNPELVGMMENQNLSGNTTNVILHDIQDYHMTPEQAAITAKNANVDYLVYYHMIPPIPNSRAGRRLFLGDALKIYNGKIDIGEDGFFISMPAHSDKIITTNLLQDAAARPGLVVLVNLIILGLMFGAGRLISKKRQFKVKPIIIVYAILMGVLILTRIGFFVNNGFAADTFIYAVVEAIMLVWSIFYLKQNRKSRIDSTPTNKKIIN